MCHPTTTDNDKSNHNSMKTKHLTSLHALKEHGFEYMGFNQYIRSGYRVHHQWKDCISSIFEFHNETFNIWTHFIGTIVFFILSFNIPLIPNHILPHIHPFHLVNGHYTSKTTSIFDISPSKFYEKHGKTIPIWPIYIYILSVLICFTSSTIYHLLYIRSYRWCLYFSQLDYFGIVILIFGAFFPYIFYGFYCYNNNILIFYIFLLILLTFFLTFFSFFQKYSKIRLILYIFTTIFCFLPIFHLIYNYGINNFYIQFTLKSLFKTAIFNFIGIIFYITKFPESFSPGSFDILGASHQWWHVFVFCASVMHYINVLQQYEWCLSTPCK